MKKYNLKDKVLVELKTTPIISIVCYKLGISRQTFYRWVDEDSGFKLKVKEAIKMGIENINDLKLLVFFGLHS